MVSHLRSFIGFGMSGMKFIELERIVTYDLTFLSISSELIFCHNMG